METIRCRIFEFAYGTALGDATRQRAFMGNESKLRNCQQAKNIVREYIDGLLNGETPDFYQAAQSVEQAFCNHIAHYAVSGVFRFGNAQKLLNMTAKQMYITVYANEKLRERFCNCHCPMDRVMVEHLIVKLEATPLETLPQSLVDFICRRGWKGMLRRPWSQIEFDVREQYELFQEGIRFFAKQNGVSPIEYDFLSWKN